jgi:hypothetical protein
VSLLENSQDIDEVKLGEVAFNTITDNEFSNTQAAFGSGHNCTFNPDKLIEAYDENKSCMRGYSKPRKKKSLTWKSC